VLDFHGILVVFGLGGLEDLAKAVLLVVNGDALAEAGLGEGQGEAQNN